MQPIDNRKLYVFEKDTNVIGYFLDGRPTNKNGKLFKKGTVVKADFVPGSQNQNVPQIGLPNTSNALTSSKIVWQQMYSDEAPQVNETNTLGGGMANFETTIDNVSEVKVKEKNSFGINTTKDFTLSDSTRSKLITATSIGVPVISTYWFSAKLLKNSASKTAIACVIAGFAGLAFDQLILQFRK